MGHDSHSAIAPLRSSARRYLPKAIGWNYGSTPLPTPPKQFRSMPIAMALTLLCPSHDGFAGFSSKDVMYLIMTDRFADGDTSNDDSPAERAKPRGWHGGDLRGITEHLDYLQKLGITTIWITPAYQNSGPESYHGYGATDMYAVDEHFGTLDDLKTLAASLHQRGMKLVLDMVPNHVGPTHAWVDDSPEPDWFHGTKANHSTAQGEFEPLVDPHSARRDRRDITQGWFAGILPDMNQENPAVAQYLTQNAVW